MKPLHQVNGIGCNMLRFITQKFKSQSINEVKPIGSQVVQVTFLSLNVTFILYAYTEPVA